MINYNNNYGMKSKRSPSFVRFLLFTIVPLLLLLLPLTNSEISAAIKITPAAVTPPSPTTNTNISANTTSAIALLLLLMKTVSAMILLIGLLQ